jgi:hypothetical protein
VVAEGFEFSPALISEKAKVSGQRHDVSQLGERSNRNVEKSTKFVDPLLCGTFNDAGGG